MPTYFNNGSVVTFGGGRSKNTKLQELNPGDSRMGNHLKIKGNSVSIMGNHNNVTGYGNVITGNHNHIHGNKHISAGNHNHINGSNCKITGNYNHIHGESNIVKGKYNTVNGEPVGDHTNGGGSVIVNGVKICDGSASIGGNVFVNGIGQTNTINIGGGYDSDSDLDDLDFGTNIVNQGGQTITMNNAEAVNIVQDVFAGLGNIFGGNGAHTMTQVDSQKKPEPKNVFDVNLPGSDVKTEVEEEQCGVCFDNKKAVAPRCGHRFYCRGCFYACEEVNQSKCPVCKVEMDDPRIIF
jgi:hypothetical protein